MNLESSIKDTEKKLGKVVSTLEGLTPDIENVKSRLEEAENEGDTVQIPKLAGSLTTMEAEKKALERSKGKLTSCLDDLKKSKAEKDYDDLLEKQRSAIFSHINTVNKKLLKSFTLLSEALDIASHPPEYTELNMSSSRDFSSDVNGKAAIQAALSLLLPGSLKDGYREGVDIERAKALPAEQIQEAIEKSITQIHYI